MASRLPAGCGAITPSRAHLHQESGACFLSRRRIFLYRQSVPGSPENEKSEECPISTRADKASCKHQIFPRNSIFSRRGSTRYSADTALSGRGMWRRAQFRVSDDYGCRDRQTLQCSFPVLHPRAAHLMRRMIPSLRQKQSECIRHLSRAVRTSCSRRHALPPGRHAHFPVSW